MHPSTAGPGPRGPEERLGARASSAALTPRSTPHSTPHSTPRHGRSRREGDQPARYRLRKLIIMKWGISQFAIN